ncbi:MAG: MMPL family transporter [Planctomycetota bacterium]
MQLSMVRRSMIGIGVIVILAPFAIWGAGRSLEGMYNLPVLWVPANDPSRRAFFRFVDEFDAHDVILVSWHGCTIDDDRLDQFGELLSQRDGGHASQNGQALYHRVITGRSSLNAIQSPPLALGRQQAIERLQGFLVGPDNTSCAMAVLTKFGTVQRRQAIELVRRVLEDELGIPAEQTHLAGTPVIGQAIDDSSVHSMVWLTLPSTALIVLCCCLFLRSWRLILVVLGVGFFGEQLAISLVHFTGNTMNAVFVVMSPLIFVLSASTGIHLCNYLREETLERGAEGAARRMIGVGWKPCLLSTITTVAGLLSLLVSEISAVRQFALFSSVSVLVTTLLMLLILPGVADTLSAKAMAFSKLRWSGMPTLSSFILKRHSSITIVCVLILATSTLGLSRARTSVELFDLLNPDSQTSCDHRWFEDNVVGLVSIETIVRFGKATDAPLVDRLQMVRAFQSAAASLPATRATMSALTFLPRVSKSGSLGATARRALLVKRFGDDRVRLAELDFLRESTDEQAWRITSRINAFGEVDYESHMLAIEAINAQVLSSPKVAEARAEVTVTGVVPVIDAAQQRLLNDLIGSFFTALIVIGIVIVVGLRSVTLGLAAMIPNVFPIGILFGMMGWLDQPLDIGVMMTASVALGIAVDDTVHFLVHWRRQQAAGVDSTSAVYSTIRHCGRAITQTTVVCGLGLLVFALSDFGPTVRFAWMMFLLLVTAWIADMVLLPALLTGPLKWIR